MQTKDLVGKLTAKTELSEEEAANFIVAFTEVLSEYFKKGEKVVISEFGSFYPKEDKTVQFNPSAKLKDLVG